MTTILVVLTMLLVILTAIIAANSGGPDAHA